MVAHVIMLDADCGSVGPADWVGLEGDWIVIATLLDQRKLKNLSPGSVDRVCRFCSPGGTMALARGPRRPRQAPRHRTGVTSSSCSDLRTRTWKDVASPEICPSAAWVRHDDHV